MKNYLKTLTALILAIISVLGVSVGCGDGHQHAFNQKIETDKFLCENVTCSDFAKYYYSCECGEKGTESFEATYEAPCVYENGKCKWCNKEYKSWQEIAENLVYNGQKTIELGAYISPASSYLTAFMRANFNKYTIVIPPKKDEETGKNVASITEKGLRSILELCEQKGIDAQIQLHHDLVRSGYNVFRDSYPNLDLKEYPAFKGFFICDEPTWSQIGYMEKEYVDWFNENYGIEACGGEAKYEFYVNFTAGYSTAIGHVLDENGNAIYDIHPETGKVVDCLDPVKQEAFYQRYINRYINNILNKVESANKYFSIDSYALNDNQRGKVIIPSFDLRDTFKNSYGIKEEDMLVAGHMPDDYEAFIGENWLAATNKSAKTAKSNLKAFATYILTCDEGGTRSFRLPTSKADITWQMYMNLAFGAKKLICYGYDHSRGGVYMTAGGQPLPLYYHVQSANSEISQIGKVLGAFDKWVGVKTFVGDGKEKNSAFEKMTGKELDSLTKVSSVVTDSDLVIGEMIDVDGNHGYMMVGYDDPYYNRTINASVTFNGADGVIVYRNGKRTEQKLENGSFSATFNIGEGIFIIPIYE